MVEELQYLNMSTHRLIIRQWKQTDYEPFAKMNQDHKVMQYFPRYLTVQESKEMIEKSKNLLVTDKMGFWALEEKASQQFLGFVALVEAKFEAKFTPCFEIGWRLKAEAWGNGFATEAALAILEYGFMTLNLNEIVSLTAKINTRSAKVMERIGMKRNPKEDFDHPKVEFSSPLCPHVLYRLRKKN